MSDSIDTEVPGDPGTIRALALALRGSIAPTITSVADSLVAARREAGDTWSSPAGEAFTSRVSEQIEPVDQLAGYLSDAASELDNLAGELEQCQNLMEGICRDAVSAGLSVEGFVIHHPGPPLPSPGPLPPDADTATAETHHRQTEAANSQNAKLDAYTEAANESSEVRAKENSAARSMGETVGRKQQLKLAFVGAGFGVDVATGLAPGRSTKHLDESKRLLEQSKRVGARLAGVTDFDKRRAMFEEGRKLRAESLRALADKPSSVTPKNVLRGVGGAIAVGGIAYDIAALDKPWHQAVVSGGAGFGASIAAGALVGTAIPIPIVGTVVGAGTGAVVGIFTSGMVDDLFESENTTVQDAFGAGASAVTDVGTATVNAGKSVWNALF